PAPVRPARRRRLVRVQGLGSRATPVPHPPERDGARRADRRPGGATVKRLIVALASWAAVAAGAQAVPPGEFPAGAAAVEAGALRKHLAGKVFRAQPASGPGWRLEYKANGYVFLDTTAGFRDTGRWSVEENRLCSTW